MYVIFVLYSACPDDFMPYSGSAEQLKMVYGDVSLAECADECRGRGNCMAFAHHTNQNKCSLLKDSIPTERNVPGYQFCSTKMKGTTYFCKINIPTVWVNNS